MYYTIQTNLSYERKVCFIFSFVLALLVFLSLQGYSFIAPSVLYSDNAITKDLLHPAPDKNKPSHDQIAHSSKIKVKFQLVRIRVRLRVSTII